MTDTPESVEIGREGILLAVLERLQAEPAIQIDYTDLIELAQSHGPISDPSAEAGASEVETAYREGFGDGMDHQNLSYKYPGEDEAWDQSEAKQALESRSGVAVEALRVVCDEMLEPGVFAEQDEIPDPALRDSSLQDLCERMGYGAVFHHVAALWAQKHPDSAHTTGPCVAVKRRVLADLRKALSRLDQQGEGGES